MLSSYASGKSPLAGKSSKAANLSLSLSLPSLPFSRLEELDPLQYYDALSRFEALVHIFGEKEKAVAIANGF